MNRTLICGHVGSIKELHTFDSGNCVIRFTVATNNYWKDSNGKQQSKVQWHKIVAYNEYAKDINEKLKVGDKIYIEGSLDYSTYTNRENINVPTTEIKVSSFNILTSKEKETTNAS